MSKITPKKITIEEEVVENLRLLRLVVKRRLQVKSFNSAKFQL